MNDESVVLAGHLGPLANAVAGVLRALGMGVSFLEYPATGIPAGSHAAAILFPFPASTRKGVVRLRDEHCGWLRKVVGNAVAAGIPRLVLRSHAIAYGSSMKNPGLLDEGRPTLLPRDSFERRWLEAESVVLDAAKVSGGKFSAAAVRLVSLLDAGEGDLIASMVDGLSAVPLAGYDPQLQLLTLEDGARCLAAVTRSSLEGVVNGAPRGTIPVKSALKASTPLRWQVNGVLQKPIRTLLWNLGAARFPGETMDRIKYNWTISSTRAATGAGFEAESTSPEALRSHLQRAGKGKPERIKREYDEFGLDADYLRRMDWWFRLLTHVFWRAEMQGIENVPAEEPALLVSNHRGFMPFDGVVHRTLILENRNRHIRFLVTPSLFKFPFLSDFLIRQGGVVASQVNTRKLFERRELVGIFPEGINGAFRMYRGAYKLGEMGKNAFAKMAIENQVPIVPAATIGHVEIFPILARVHSQPLTRVTGWPFLPITPTFPLLPFPLPTKWHIRYLEPIPVDRYAPEDGRNPKAVNELAERVSRVLQENIDDLLARRRHLFRGRVFDAPGQGKERPGAAG